MISYIIFFIIIQYNTVFVYMNRFFAEFCINTLVNGIKIGYFDVQEDIKVLRKISLAVFIFTILITLAVVYIKSMRIVPDYKAINAAPDEIITEIPIEIKLSHWSLGYMKGFEQAIKKYNDTAADYIRLSLLDIPQYMYEETLNMLMASGEGPDIIGLNEELINPYINRGWLVDLTKYIDNDFLEKYPEWALNIAADPVYKNKLYAIPSSIVTYRLIYNKDLFKISGLNPENPPTTIDELKEYAIKISNVCKGERKYGFALPAGQDWTGFVQSMEGPATYSGIYYYDYAKGIFDLTSYEPWLQAFIDMKKSGGLFPGESSLKIDSARMQFAEGNIGMMLATSWEPAILTYRYPANCNWDVSMPPALSEDNIGKGAVIMTAGSCYAINSKSRHESHSAEIWRMLYSKDFLGDLYRTGAELPILKEILDDDTYKPDIRNFEKFIPTDMDSSYPGILNGFDKWSRMKAYYSIITEDVSVSAVLKEESVRLENLFNNRLLLTKSSKDDYRNMQFDPLNPLRK